IRLCCREWDSPPREVGFLLQRGVPSLVPCRFGLTASRAAEHVLRPSACVLRAALTSRSCTAPQAGQVHSRTANGRRSSSWPQAEHLLELGYQRLTATR